MSSSRPAQKIFSTVSTLQKLRLQNPPANERPKNKYLAWLSLRWAGANQETSDGKTDTLKGTGIVADSIFLHSLEATSLRQEKLITSDGATCPAECSQLQPDLPDLGRERCELPIDSKQVKGPVIGAKKNSLRRLKTSSSRFQANATTKFSGLRSRPFPGSERMKAQSYWVVPENDACAKTPRTEGPIDLRRIPTYCVKTQTATRSRTSTPSSLPSAYNTLNRLYSAKKDATDKPKKARKKADESFDWLKAKSLNECKKRLGKCDPNIKPLKNAGPKTPSPMGYPSTPMTPRAAETGSLAMSFNTHKRFYSDKKEAEAKPEESAAERELHANSAKPEESVPEEVMKAKEPEPVAEAASRCAKAKCGAASLACQKPPSTNQHRCPKKPVPTGRRKKRVKPEADTKKAE